MNPEILNTNHAETPVQEWVRLIKQYDAVHGIDSHVAFFSAQGIGRVDIRNQLVAIRHASKAVVNPAPKVEVNKPAVALVKPALFGRERVLATFNKQLQSGVRVQPVMNEVVQDDDQGIEEELQDDSSGDQTEPVKSKKVSHPINRVIAAFENDPVVVELAKRREATVAK